MWIWGALLPHAPVLVPEVGGAQSARCSQTIEGFRMVAESVTNDPPDCMLLLDPHAPAGGGIVFYPADRYRGDLAEFGARTVSVDTPGASEDAQALIEWIGAGCRTSVDYSKTRILDYAAIVSLAPFMGIWKSSFELLLANPTGLSPREAFNAGERAGRFFSSRKWALAASGDLSHRLTREAPTGYHPDGITLDAAIVYSLKHSSPDKILEMQPSTIFNAAECGLCSVMFLLGLAGNEKISVFSYESPFGVGYATGLWMNNDETRSVSPPALARMAVENNCRGKPLSSAPRGGDEAAYDRPAACFVSIKTASGELRGCMGTLHPVQASLSEEIISNAVEACSRDPRFAPVSSDELDHLVFSVDILSEAVPVKQLSELDPRRYGVIVSSGYRKGVLLPDIEGVATVEQQISIAMQKAGISQEESLDLFRFTVDRYVEKP